MNLSFELSIQLSILTENQIVENDIFLFPSIWKRFIGVFNIGINQGKDAGQTIFHCHIHLIPRRAGDVENPRGGIRHLIPGKGGYWVVYLS